MTQLSFSMVTKVGKGFPYQLRYGLRYLWLTSWYDEWWWSSGL